MSPLIDCVFLLLIFFLVTTMMKKLEKQIPVELPSNASVPAAATQEQEVIFGLNQNGEYLFADPKKRDREGNYSYAPLSQADTENGQKMAFAQFLANIANERGNEVPIRIDADRELEIQQVIDALDIAQIAGFEKVSVRMMSEGNTFFGIPKELLRGSERHNLRPDIP